MLLKPLDMFLFLYFEWAVPSRISPNIFSRYNQKYWLVEILLLNTWVLRNDYWLLFILFVIGVWGLKLGKSSYFNVLSMYSEKIGEIILFRPSFSLKASMTIISLFHFFQIYFNVILLSSSGFLTFSSL